jgi:acetoin utilization protein AcuC
VGRLWSGVWATLNNNEIPDRLPEPARAILAALSWTRRPALPDDTLIDTLRDAPRPGPIADDLRAAVQHLRTRSTAWV